MSAQSIRIIRPATPADVAALGRLGALLVKVHHEFDQDRFIAPTPKTQSGYGSFLSGQLKRAGVVVLVAEEAGSVVGYTYAALEGNDWLTLRGPAGMIYDLMVDPEHRRQGVGRQLLEATIAALQALGAPRSCSPPPSETGRPSGFSRARGSGPR